MSTDIIRYDLLVQDALRSVVRKVLTESAREGLPGEHHYYITFRTDAPGVRLSSRMREKYPGEMTIILQHQFWDLSVTEQNFEVGLSFNGINERLLITFDALTGFFDPSVQFGLKFEIVDIAPEAGANDTTALAGTKPAADKPARSVKNAEKALQRGVRQDLIDAKPAVKPAISAKPAKSSVATAPVAAPATPAKVVSIDAFRKKT